uniref:Peptidase A1 domain-containing protein n=1 Tax=Neolamprologus brichardi TaxID=32507 RepID=A0A3Q4G5V2_NEOBR
HKCLVVVLVWVVLAEGTVKHKLQMYSRCMSIRDTRRKFDPQQSSTSTAKCLYFYLPYETRSLGGVFRCDTVNVGGIVITNQIFLTAFSDYPDLSISAGRRTPSHGQHDQNLLSSKIFCFFLSSGTELIFIICWTPATSETYRQIGVQGSAFLINTGWCSQSCQAILETSMLTAPNQLVNYTMQCHGTNTFSSECNNLPTLHCFLLVLPPPAYVIQNQNGCQYCSVSMTPTYQPSPNGQALRTFGDYGWTNSRVGFAIVV